METAMRNVSINDRTTPSMSPLIKSEPAIQQDQPIDFSTKVRTHTIEPDDNALRKVSNDSAIDVSEDTNLENNTPAANTEVPNPEQPLGLIGQPRVPPVSMPMPNISTFLPQSSSMAGMGMFYPGAPMFPNFIPPGFTAPPMWPNPMAAMMQQQQEAARKLISQAASNNKQAAGSGVRSPFGKHLLGKQDLMGMTAGGRGFPAMPGFPNPAMATPNISNIPDPNILAEALKSHEEMFSAYKQQVLNQKAAEEAKRGSRRQPPATVTNGNHSSTPQTNISVIPNVPEGPPSSSLSQISEDQESQMSPDHQSINPSDPSKLNENNSNGAECSRENLSSSEDDKNSGNGSVGDISAAGSAPATNGNGLNSATNSTGPSLHSSDESLQNSDGRRSLTPAHSSNGELNDITGMRPRSMTLPTQMADNRLMSHSPSPSVLSTGNNSSGPGTPNSKNDRGFRKRARTLPDDQKDEAYWERRRKNNEAAKRSRDSRRAKEDEIAIRAAFLEQENIRLRLELATLKTQTAKLRSELIIFQGPDDQSAGPSGQPTSNGS